MTNLNKRIDTDDISNLAVTLEKLSQAVQDALGGGSSPLTTKGDVYTFSTVAARLAVGADGKFLRAHSAAATGLDWADPTPLTTKGDILGFSTVLARLPVGSNTQVLTADSAQTLGVKWADAASGASNLPVSGGSTNRFTGDTIALSKTTFNYVHTNNDLSGGTLTLNLPAAAADGDEVRGCIVSNNAVKGVGTITWGAGALQAFADGFVPPAATTTNITFGFIFDAFSATWVPKSGFAAMI